MNNLTVSLSTAKKLKEAGWSKETYFSYSIRWDGIGMLRDTTELRSYPDLEYYFACPDGVYAPTLQEILEELPYITLHRIKAGKSKNWYYMIDNNFGGKYRNIKNDNPNECASLFYLKLKAEGFI